MSFVENLRKALDPAYTIEPVDYEAPEYADLGAAVIERGGVRKLVVHIEGELLPAADFGALAEMIEKSFNAKS